MITVQDIAYVRYGAPDLDAMQAFLIDFGLHVAHRSGDALYMRAAGGAPFVHATERSDQPATLGFGLIAASLEDLRTLAATIDAQVQDNLEPGGGKVVRFTDPAGLRVDVVWGQAPCAPLACREAVPHNRIGQRHRVGSAVRLAPAPSHTMRLGHVAIHVKDFPLVADFYQRVLGFKVSDSYWAGAQENTIAVFLHCGLGATWTDHHTVALVAAGDNRTRFDHSAFEVLDMDDLMQGSAHLAQRGYTHSWGVGRHIQGSQIFDYWRDPFGNKIEHWTDGDVVNDDTVPTHAELQMGELSQWAPPLSPEFFA
jgi:catechol 2,3-dioxygenase-like lactoylglutathione lyase family enzyme